MRSGPLPGLAGLDEYGLGNGSRGFPSSHGPVTVPAVWSCSCAAGPLSTNSPTAVALSC